MLREFAVAHNMMIMNIQFQHTPIHKGIWISPDQNTIKQIVHAFVNAKKKKEIIQDIKSMRGPSKSDKQKLLTIYRKNLTIQTMK
jgi:hypothetical protein